MKHYGDGDGLKVLSYNGIVTYVRTNRNYGKTWTFKRRAVRRNIKHNKKTLWLRVFKKEYKEAKADFFSSADLQKFCGLEPYDKESNKGNFKQIGDTFYLRHGKKWHWFLKIKALTDADALRSVDDVNLDTIVLDEGAKEKPQLARFRGDMINNLLDIFFTSKREHQVRIIILGNKENINDNILSYFHIKQLPTTYEGIRTFRKGSFVIQQINNVQPIKNEYDAKVKALLEGTTYGNYIYEQTYKNETKLKTRKTPPNANVYCQIYINNQPIKISVLNGFFYVNNKIDNSKRVFCDTLKNKFSRERVLVKKQKQLFNGLINAVADNRVYYASVKDYGAIQDFYKWLGI